MNPAKVARHDDQHIVDLLEMLNNKNEYRNDSDSCKPIFVKGAPNDLQPPIHHRLRYLDVKLFSLSMVTWNCGNDNLPWWMMLSI